ncbi:helix-turn-helix domain-containing protein [Brevibacterium spongiae]|uniref:Helix-turn-helix domain-containing protein n=1 Tax=Brevibacterium spongiae TaxID=2909672 RepID=A0ABY5SRY5_9MICO|nr:helix-turn-helix domain-containing protein [Brevibacterium spongiae]UVI37307.1 helix-turn-helix domain-containing protein [Brevibacterium spongiae]
MDEEVTRRKASPAPDHFYGRVLKPGELLDHARYSSVRVVAERLRPFVRRYWAVDWDLPAGEAYQSSTVSESTINLTFEFGTSRRSGTDGPGAWVTGPVTQRRFDVAIFGRGGVFGVNFHLGATQAFSGEMPADIRDSTVPAAQWFPALERDLGLDESFFRQSNEPDIAALAEAVESWLLSRRPQMSGGYMKLKHLLGILDDPEVVSLGMLSARAGVTERTVQRMFSRYCGVGVKKVLARARIIDAVGAIDRGWDGSLADLAVRFGWFDQSHFSADFLNVTGFSPGEYAQRKSARRGRS